MDRRVSWSEELIEPVVLHEPPVEHRTLVERVEEAASPNAEEPAVPEKASAEGASDELERRLNSEPLDGGSPAGMPSGSRFAPNIAVWAGSAIVMAVATISLLALMLAGTTSAEARLRATTEGRAHGEDGHYMPEAKSTRKAATTTTRDDNPTNATVAPEGAVDKHTAGATGVTHGYRQSLTTRLRDSRQNRKRHRDGQHSSSVKGRVASEGRHSVPTAPTSVEHEVYQVANNTQKTTGQANSL
ncbi:hypothetical protein MTO96_043494 [Rhipicephalus appendiculatus]